MDGAKPLAYMGLYLLTALAGSLGPGNAWAGAGDLLWEERFVVAGGQTTASSGPLAVAPGKVFVAPAGPFDNSPSSNANILVEAYEASTGNLLWANTWDVDHDDGAAGIAVGQGLIFVGGGSGGNTFDRKSFIVSAYNSDTGDRVWQDRCGHFSPSSVAPNGIVAQANRVFAAGNCLDRDFAGTGLVRAYDAQSGAVLWEVAHDAGFMQGIAVQGGQVFVVGRDGSGTFVRSHDGAAGTASWEARPESTPSTFITAAAGKVFVGSAPAVSPTASLVAAYDADTGTFLWQDAPGDSLRAIAVDAGRLFVVGSGQTFLVRAYDAASGERTWQDQPGGIHGGAITVGQGEVFVAGAEALRAYSAANGRLLWDAGPGASAVGWTGGRVFTSRLEHFVPPPGPLRFEFELRSYDAR